MVIFITIVVLKMENIDIILKNMKSEERQSKLLANKIKKLRLEKRISQSHMKDVIGISQAAYAKIENGTTKNITIETGKGIARALGVDFSELFGVSLSERGFFISQLEEYKNKAEKLKEELLKANQIVELLSSEKRNLKEFFVMQFVSHYSNYIGFIEDLIDQAPTEEFKSMLQRKKENTIRFEKTIQQKFIDMGLFTMGDVAKYINEMKIMGLHLKDINEME